MTMESSTGSSDDSSICGLVGIEICNQIEQKENFGREFEFLKENDSSEEWQEYVDDGNYKPHIIIVLSDSISKKLCITMSYFHCFSIGDPWPQRSCQARVTEKVAFGRGEGGTGSS